MRRRLDRTRLAELRSLHVLRHCDDAELGLVDQAAERLEIGAGHALVHAGERSDDAFVIVSGTLDVVVGADLVVGLGPGELAGELGPLGAKERSADLVARTDVVVLRFADGSLRRLLADCAGLRRAVTPLLAARVDAIGSRAT